MSQPLVHPLRLVFFSKEYTIIIKTRILSQDKTKIQKKVVFIPVVNQNIFHVRFILILNIRET